MACSVVEEFASRLAEAGWRGLIVAHSRDPASAARALAGAARGDCVHVAPGELRGAGCRVEASPMDLDLVLGLEAGAAIASTRGLLRPSVIAAAGETVRAGGFLAVAAPPRDEWSPGPAGGTGFYRDYLYDAIPRARAHLWLDLDECTVYSSAGPPPGPGPRAPWRPKRAPPGVHGRVYRLARTPGQARVLEEAALLARGRARSLLVVGDRGRGKSFAAGLALAQAVALHAVGRAAVVAPSPAQAQQVMRGLQAGLEAAGVRARVRESRGLVVRVTGPWFRVSYETPFDARGAPMVVVDEAAAIGVARVRKLAWESGQSIVATTVHGYEGSGRAFVHLVDRVLPRPARRVELEEPIRYHPGDPLEEWLYETFMLRVDPPRPGPELGEPRYRVAGPGDLAGDPGLLRAAYSVLALAHYRNTPDDVMAMLESPHYTVHLLEHDWGPAAVALTAWEDWGAPQEARLGLAKLALYTPRARGLEGPRVVRIAVLPGLQRRGLGSRLLGHVEDWARGRGGDVVTTMFSRHEVIGFWSANGYLYYYVSPRYNRVTGEKNVAAAKGLTSEGAAVVEEASGELRARLVLAAHTVYRDLAAEKTVEILAATAAPREPPTLQPSPGGLARLRECARGRLDPEQALDALYLVYASRVLAEGPGRGPEAVYLVARLLQGKPHDEAARIAGMGEVDAYEALKRACAALAGRPGG